jgi:vacuolar-type H+-ATPase subunit F/Vma7
MADIIIIGGSDFVLGFYLTGLRRIYEIKDYNKADKIFKDLLEDNSIGLIITDNKTLAHLNKDLRRKVENSTRPVAINLSLDEDGGENLRELIRKSIGVDLWVS